MKSKKMKYMIAVSMALILTVGGVYATLMDQLTYVGKFETDKVDIRLQELAVMGEGEEAVTSDIVEANQDVSYIPRITNRSAECYVRVSVDVTMEGECVEPLDVNCIYGLGGDWVLRGDYYYYTKILKKGESVDVFKGLHIPEDWDYGEADGFSIAVRADAVQSANFIPDFRQDLPWGAVALQEVSAAENDSTMEVVPVESISNVEYSGDGGFQCNSSELFDEFTAMMPGDRLMKTVNIKNAADNQLKASLKIDAGESRINEKLHVRVSADGKELYDGTAADADGFEAVDMIEIPEGSQGNVILEMTLPADAGNEYSSIKDDIVWELIVKEVPDDSVQTGDASSLWIFAAAGLLALMVMAAVMMRGRRNKNETGH